ncbi:hypothetical protein [Ornithinibacillus caprae]|nr:hypothetical protein [Ornithinibacillus caprae]
MQQSHQMGYAEYSRKLEKRMDVEKRRHQEYEKCKHMISELESQIHK